MREVLFMRLVCGGCGRKSQTWKSGQVEIPLVDSSPLSPKASDFTPESVPLQGMTVPTFQGCKDSVRYHKQSACYEGMAQKQGLRKRQSAE